MHMKQGSRIRASIIRKVHTVRNLDRSHTEDVSNKLTELLSLDYNCTRTFHGFSVNPPHTIQPAQPHEVVYGNSIEITIPSVYGTYEIWIEYGQKAVHQEYIGSL